MLLSGVSPGHAAPGGWGGNEPLPLPGPFSIPQGSRVTLPIHGKGPALAVLVKLLVAAEMSSGCCPWEQPRLLTLSLSLSSPGVNLLVGTENGLMLLDRSGQGKVYNLINRRRFQQMDVLEGLNVLVTISGAALVLSPPLPPAQPQALSGSSSDRTCSLGSEGSSQGRWRCLILESN